MKNTISRERTYESPELILLSVSTEYGFAATTRDLMDDDDSIGW